MRSLKEKGWKPVSNDAFQIYNIYRRLYGWVATSHTYKKEYLLQFSTFSCHICYFYQMQQSLSIFRFSFAKLTLKFSIIYDNSQIKDCRHKQGQCPFLQPFTIKLISHEAEVITRDFIKVVSGREQSVTKFVRLRFNIYRRLPDLPAPSRACLKLFRLFIKQDSQSIGES